MFGKCSSARHASDAHGGVIDGDAKVVHRHAVGAQDDEITERIGVPSDLASHHVVDLDAFALRTRSGT